MNQAAGGRVLGLLKLWQLLGLQVVNMCLPLQRLSVRGRGLALGFFFCHDLPTVAQVMESVHRQQKSLDEVSACDLPLNPLNLFIPKP